MEKRSRLLVAALLLLTVATVLAQTTTGAPTFGQPTISGIQGVGFEQDIRLDPTDATRVYTSVPGSLSSDTSWIWRSTDGGKTFKWVTAAAPKTGKPNTCAGGGDTELAVDTGGNLYFNDLTLVNFSTARSDDAGVRTELRPTPGRSAVVRSGREPGDGKWSRQRRGPQHLPRQ